MFSDAYLNLIYFFVLGLFAGSALNCIIYRLKTGENFWWGRSFCPKCRHVLKWYDLVPVFSFLALKGKCRYCRGKISWQYPLVEISTALIFLLIFNFEFQISNQFSIFNFQNIFNAIYLAIISSFLIIIFVYDLKHYIIPDKILFPAIGIVFLYNLILNSKFLILNSLFSAFGAMAFFLLIFLISKGKWMGFGDVKLAFFMGLFLGYPNVLVALFLAFFFGAIIGIGLILAKKKDFKSEVPFGPFLIIGTFLALFWGDKLINWYLNLFL
jgi:prepilin signal peptidase PulO-like enzyme (type II secretory pathway)